MEPTAGLEGLAPFGVQRLLMPSMMQKLRKATQAPHARVPHPLWLGEGMEDSVRFCPLRPKTITIQAAILKYRTWPIARLLFAWTGTVLRGVWKGVLLAMLIASAVTFFVQHYAMKFTNSLEGHTVAIVPIGLLLVIRSNLAYSRYWEGREMVKTLIFCAREIVSKLRSFVRVTEGQQEPDPEHPKKKGDGETGTTGLRREELIQQGMLRYLIAFLILVRTELSRAGSPEELKGILTVQEIISISRTRTNRPLLAATWLREAIVAAHAKLALPSPYAARTVDH